MAAEYHRYIPKIQSLHLNEVTAEQKSHVAEVYGPDFLKEPSCSDYLQARSYLTSPEKFESDCGIRLAATVACFGALSHLLALGVKAIDGGTGFYYLDVGWRLSRDLTEIKDKVVIKKIRSLKIGTDTSQESLFDQATFQNNKEHYLDGHRVPHIGWLLRIGLDEMPQFNQVGKDMSGIGNRASTYKELYAEHILYQLRNEPDLEFSDEVIGILETHHELTCRVDYSKPSIINLRSGLDPDLATHMIRVLTADRYLALYSP